MLSNDGANLGPAIIAPLRDTLRYRRGAGRRAHHTPQPIHNPFTPIHNPFTDDERDLLAGYADHAAVALQYSMTQQRTLELELRERR